MTVPALAACRWVLIVQDDDAPRELARDLLEMEGYAVSAVASGREGLEQIEKRPYPCLILLAWRMPVMSGAQFLAARSERAKSRQDRVVVIAHAQDGARARREHELAGVLLEPVDTQELLRLVDAHCTRALGPAPGGLASAV